MQNKNTILIWLSIIVCVISFLFLTYVAITPTIFDVKNNLFIVPKLTTTEDFSISKIKKYNKDNFNATYEIPDALIIKSNNKTLDSKIIATNEMYPFVYKVPILIGGFFTLDHLELNAKVAVLNKKAAFNFFGSFDCLGEQVSFNNTSYNIVGVIDDGDDKNNVVYYPSGYTDKNPKNLMISFKNSSVDEVLASLNVLGISKDYYYIINLDNVITLLYDKAFFALDIFIFIIAIKFIVLIIKKIILQVIYIKGLLLTSFYLSELILKKFLLIIHLAFNICLGLCTFYYVLIIANRYVVYSMKLKVDWLFIKKATSFEVMTDAFYKLNTTTSVAWVLFLVTILYTLALCYISKKIIKGDLKKLKKLKKLIKVTALITTVFALSSCGKTEPKKAPEQTSEKAPEKSQALDLSKIEGEIVISNFNFMGQPGEESFLDTAAKMFMEKYPNTKITINNVGTPPEIKMSESEGGSFAIVKSDDTFNQEIIEYKKQVGVDLLGGGGADIYNVGTVLSPVPFIEKGYLEDLNAYMNSDTTFDKNNYHDNLFEAMKYKDGIYSIPTEFEFSFYSVDGEIVPENLKSEILAKQGLKYLEMLEYGVKARENSDVKSITSESLLMCLNLYLMENLESFVDLETKKVSFNDGRLEKVIDTLKSYDKAGYLGKDINFEEMDQEKWQERMAEKYPFYTATIDDIFTKYLNDLIEDIPEEEKAYMEMFAKRENAGLMFNEDGKASYTTNNSFVMNANSKNKALSWAFIKFLLSDEMQGSLSFSGLPVQKEAIKNQISYYASQGKIETLTEKQKEAIDNCVDDINSYVSRLDMYSFQNDNVVEIVTKAIDKFIKEDQTSKEMIDSIQSAVELYINEQ